MKSIEKTKAIEMRKQGLSMSDISRLIKVSKSSVSLWVRNIKLNPAQRKELSKKGILKETVERRRTTRLANEHNKRQIVIDYAYNQVQAFNLKELWLMGTILYWAEGGKTGRNSVNFSNSDPHMIKFIMAYFRKTCFVQENKFRCHIHTYSHLNAKIAEKYWSGITHIPVSQFFKTYIKRTKSGKHPQDKLPYGTLSIYVSDTKLFLTISGWIRGIFKFIDMHSK